MTQVPFVQKFAYAASGFGGSACQAAIAAYLMFFYTDVALLGVGLAGLVKGIGRIFDAINDPLIGYLSDKTSTRWGRRRPWIAGAVLPFGLVFALLFRPPATTDQTTLFLYLLVSLLALDVFGTMLQIPGIALGTELSSDYHERTQIFAWGTLFSQLGTIVGGLLPALVARFPDAREGYAQVSLWFAVFAVLTTSLLLLILERREGQQQIEASWGDFLHGYRACLRNREFRLLLLTFCVMSIGGGIGHAVGIYALVYWLGFTQREVGFLIALALGASCVGLPFWTGLSVRIGKDMALKWLLFYEIGLRCVMYFLVPYKPLVYAYMAVVGFGIGGLMLVLSLLTDVLDTDELETGTRRAGAFLGFWTLVMKGARAAGPVIVGGVLAVAGYVPNVAQTPFVVETLRWLYGPIPSLFFVVGYLVFRRFSLTRERVSEVQAELARRRNFAVEAVRESG